MAGGLHTAVDCFPPFYDGYMGAFQISQANETFAKEASKAIYGQQIYGREEAVSAFAAGPKTCAQCGTTRTPQWREGPKGPKTLCNACGVKRVRQMRTGSEGARKKAAKTPLVPSQEYAEAAVAADCAGPRDPTQRRPARRPTASKTAGKSPEEGEQLDWQEEEDDLSCRSSQEAGSADTGGHNSDSAEEVAWVPERHTQARHLPPSPMARAVGPECAAAVNLLSMSIREDALKQTAQPQQRSTSGDMLKDVPKINAASYAQMANSALKWSSHMPSHAEAQNLIQDALAGLPEEKHTRILTVKAELDSVSREAAAADAAVAAVAKILAMKQAAAIKARASAAKAAKRIHTFMQNLENEYGWGQQGLKRHRSFQ